MKGNKKVNLLPVEIKNKYINKYLIYAAAAICGAFVIALSVQYINIGVLSHSIHTMQQKNERFNEEKSKMEQLQKKITEHREFLDSYRDGKFPFSDFMRDLELSRPYSVSIISVDSKDRLVNEGVPEKKEEIEQKEEKTEPEETENTENTDNPEESEQPKEPEAKIEYQKDLADEEITVRGYGTNQEDISKFIYAITNLGYIKSAKITAIEQRELEGNLVNIFEISVVGGALN